MILSLSALLPSLSVVGPDAAPIYLRVWVGILASLGVVAFLHLWALWCGCCFFNLSLPFLVMLYFEFVVDGL